MNGTPASSVDRALIALIACAISGLSLICCEPCFAVECFGWLRRTAMALETRSIYVFLKSQDSGSLRAFLYVEASSWILAGTGELAFCGVAIVDTV
jgi:hypothetical protein